MRSLTYEIKFVFLLFICLMSIWLLGHPKNLQGKKRKVFLPNICLSLSFNNANGETGSILMLTGGFCARGPTFITESPNYPARPYRRHRGSHWAIQITPQNSKRQSGGAWICTHINTNALSCGGLSWPDGSFQHSTILCSALFFSTAFITILCVCFFIFYSTPPLACKFPKSEGFTYSAHCHILNTYSSARGLKGTQ